MHRAAILFCWLPLASTFYISGAEPVAFQRLETPDAVTSMAVTPDLQFLLVAHQEANKVTVWEVADPTRQAGEFECPAPRFILSRGDKVYVGSYDSGMINIFDRRWKLINQVRSGIRPLYHLAAPKGNHFADKMIAVGQGESGANGMVVDLAQDQQSLLVKDRSLMATPLSSDGRYLLMTQDSTSDRLEAYKVGPSLSSVTRETTGDHGRSNLLMQSGDSPYWVGDHSVATGQPLKPVLKVDSRQLIVADQVQPLFYTFKENQVIAQSLNDELVELDRRPVERGECERLDPQRHPMSHHFVKKVLYEHLAISQDKQTVFFVVDEKNRHIYFARTQPFGVPAHIAQASKFPRQIVAGKKLTFPIFGVKTPGEYEVMGGPANMQVSPTGELSWTPGEADVGPQEIKIRAETNGKTIFQRLTTSVVSAEMASALGGDLQRIEDAGKFAFDKPVTALLIAGDRKSMLALAGEELAVLDAGGFVETKRVRLTRSYKKLAEREKYFVALADNAVDLLDKKTLEVSRSLALEAGVAVDMALHPAKATIFLTIYDNDGGRRGSLESRRVVELVESSGKVTPLPRMYGTYVTADPTGKYLFVAIRDRYEQGLRIDWHIGRIMPEFGEIDLLLSYDISGRAPRHLTTNLKAGSNGRRIVATPDGRQIAYVSGGGTPEFSYAIPAFKAEDVNVMARSYATGAYPNDIDFHPTLDLVAGANGKLCKLFERSTGEEVADRFTIPQSQQVGPVSLARFTASGNRLLLGGEKKLFSLPVKFTDAELATLKKGIPAPRLVTRDTSNSGEPSTTTPEGGETVEGAPVPTAQLQALNGEGASRTVTAKEISRYFTKSVVQIDSGDGQGTGFVVGEQGYILTCAHVLPVVGDPKVSFDVGSPDAPRVETVNAQVVRVDRAADLALLKIAVKKPLRTVQFAKNGPVEAAEDVTVIGNPGVGETILTNSVTTGIVSNVRRKIEGMELIQTSAPINPGNSGGPMFDSRGQVVGVVVAKANLENTGFAIPIDSVLKFLAPNPANASAVVRTWSDASGKFQVKATLVEVSGNQVHLRRQSNGQVIKVPVAQLSPADLEFIRQQQRSPAP